MSLIDDLLAELPNLRAEAESLMTDAGVTHRPGEGVTDPETGVFAPGLTEVYAGKCKLQGAKAMANEPEAGGHRFMIENLQLHFPIGSDLRANDVHTLTDSVLDPTNVGLKFRLTEQDRGTFRTAERWNVELVVS